MPIPANLVAVNDNGEIVEQGSVESVFTNPNHAITQSLLSELLKNDLPDFLQQQLHLEGKENDDVEWKIPINIISGNLDHIGKATFGHLVVSLKHQALYETLLMVFGSTGIGILLGVPVGVILYNTSQQGLQPCKKVYGPLSFLVNGARNIIGTSIGTGSAIVPLSIAAALLIARCVEDALRSVPKGLSEVGISFGATPFEIIRKILLPESMAPLIAGITTVIINLVGYSAMAGTVGGGGLGDLAIRYGYQRYDTVLTKQGLTGYQMHGMQMLGYLILLGMIFCQAIYKLIHLWFILIEEMDNQ
eukprot:gene14730-14856_t